MQSSGDYNRDPPPVADPPDHPSVPLGPPVASAPAHQVQIESEPEPEEAQRIGDQEDSFVARDGLIEERDKPPSQEDRVDRVPVVERRRGTGAVVDDDGRDGQPRRPEDFAQEAREARVPAKVSRQDGSHQADDVVMQHEVSHSTPYSSVNGVASSSGQAGSSGLPLLSGPPPVTESDACRHCGKNFIPLFRRAHNCNHCGYQYCEDHCNQHALLPRSRPGNGGRDSASGSGNATPSVGDELKAAAHSIGEAFGFGSSSGGGESSRQGSGAGRGNQQGGYEPVEVCLNCSPMLRITAGSPSYLRSLPLKQLQGYIKAYGLTASNAIEKEDFVQAILKAKSPHNGCLSPERESYYRRRSVPREGVMPAPPPVRPAGSATGAARPPGSQARTPNGTAPRPATGPTPAYRPASSAPRPPQPQYHARPPGAPQVYTARPARPPTVPRPPATSPRPPVAAAPTPKRVPSPPVPTISSLVALPASYIGTLGVGTLKAILFENHVKVDFSQVLEKDELVKRVTELCREERRRLERQAREEEAEEAAARAAAAGVAQEANPSPRASLDAPDGMRGTSPSPAPAVPTGPTASVERDGLCVVCQENEAQLAVVDCGHLSMCQECAGLVMKTSRECPMCRTRIVTDQRLIRIFRA